MKNPKQAKADAEEAISDLCKYNLPEDQIRELKNKLLKFPEMALYYSIYFNKSFPEAEASLATKPNLAAQYAASVLKGPFPLGEATIAKDGYYSIYYAEKAIKGRFELGEEAIAKNKFFAQHYALFLSTINLENEK